MLHAEAQRGGVALHKDVDVLSDHAAAGILGDIDSAVDDHTRALRDDRGIGCDGVIFLRESAGAGHTSPTLGALIARAVGGELKDTEASAVFAAHFRAALGACTVVSGCGRLTLLAALCTRRFFCGLAGCRRRAFALLSRGLFGGKAGCFGFGLFFLLQV